MAKKSSEKSIRLSAKSKQVVNSILTVSINNIPFIGPAIVEGLNFNTNVKQARFQNFIKELAEFMETAAGKQIDLEHIQSTEFIDIFEFVIKKVVETKSNEKLKLFRNILIRNMAVPSIEDQTISYLKLIAELSDEQISILRDYELYWSFAMQMNSKEPAVEEKAKRNWNLFRERLSPKEDDFPIRDLVSKGLLTETQGERGRGLTITPRMIRISNFGHKLLDFIRELEE